MSIYLDYNANAPLCQQAIEAMQDAFQYIGNPSSIHHQGRKIRGMIEKTRQQIADDLCISNQHLIFTSGATESNNLALCHFPGRVIVSAIEHDSVRLARPDALILPVLPEGIINLEALEKILRQPYEGITLISVMIANNETGIIQPLEEVLRLSEQYKAFVHSDGVQGIGRLNFPWQKLDMLSISAHKIGGPAGVGFLMVKPNIPLKPLNIGGGQERSYRPGTENFIGIVGLGAAFNEGINQDWSAIKILRDHMESKLLSYSPTSKIIGQTANRLPNTTLMATPHIKSETQMMKLDLCNVAVSSGSACSSGKVRTSHVLKAMQIPDVYQSHVIRISIGPKNSPEEIGIFLQIWQNILKSLKKEGSEQERSLSQETHQRLTEAKLEEKSHATKERSRESNPYVSLI